MTDTNRTTDIVRIAGSIRLVVFQYALGGRPEAFMP